MNCISRRDHTNKNLFVEKNDRKDRRWNLYSQIAIKNDMLVCDEKAYNLTDICHNTPGYYEPKSCTLLDTKDVVDIGFDGM